MKRKGIDQGRAARYGSVAACAIVLGACSLVVDVDRPQCNSADDCSAEITGEKDLICDNHICIPETKTGRWTCVNTPAPSVEPGEQSFTLEVISAVTRDPIQGASLRVCTGLDQLCTSPTFGPVITDADGKASITASKDFKGFVEIEATGFVPEIFGLDMAVRQYYPVVPVPLQLLTSEQLGALAGLAGVTIDETLGQITLLVADCDAAAAPGVTLTAEPEGEATTRFYFQGGFASSSATATDEDGTGGFLNAPAGRLVTVHAFVADLDGDGKDDEVGSVTLVSRAGWLTVATIFPTRN